MGVQVSAEHLRLAIELWMLMSFYQWSAGRAWWGLAASCVSLCNMALLRWVA
jgi:hypothetical protein